MLKDSKIWTVVEIELKMILIYCLEIMRINLNRLNQGILNPIKMTVLAHLSTISDSSFRAAQCKMYTRYGVGDRQLMVDPIQYENEDYDR